MAYANAISSARLATFHPESGGTYVYGRRRLGHGWGFDAATVKPLLAAALLFTSVVAGVVVLLIGLLGRSLRTRR